MNESINFDDLDITNDEEFNKKESKAIALEMLEESQKVSPKSLLDFESDSWAVWVESSEHKRHVNFNEISSLLQFKPDLLNNGFIEVVKCWTATIIYYKSPYTLQPRFRGLKLFLEVSNFFDKDKLEVVETYLRHECNDRKALEVIVAALNFLDFYKDFTEHQLYTVLLNEVRESLSIEVNSRKLPPTEEVYLFHEIVEHYFENINKKSEEYLFYFPIYFWWKLTMIIPLRPCELVKIKHDCLTQKDGKYYISLPREKRNKSKIQIADQIMINKSFAVEIQQYLRMLEGEPKSETLLYPNTIGGEQVSGYKRRYSTPRHRYILFSFYKHIIKGKYGITMKVDKNGYPKACDEEEIELYDITLPINTGDTRHFSMLNLMRQGYHPIEIARLAGHTTLTVQRTYYGHLEYWVDSTMLKLMDKVASDLEGESKTLLDEEFKKKFIFNNQSEVKIPLDLGYCVDPDQNCLVESHFYCEHFRLSAEEYLYKHEEIFRLLNEENAKINELKTILVNLQRISNTSAGGEFEYSENDIIYNKDLKDTRKQLDLALNRYNKVNFHYKKSLNLKRR